MKVKYLIKGKLYDPILFGDEDDDLQEKDMKDLDVYIKKQEKYNEEHYKRVQRILKEIGENKKKQREQKRKRNYDEEM